MTRRRLLTSTASLAAAAFASSLMPPNLRKALADPPQRSGLQDIKHVVILMQENRSFDHYYGTLAGVRGFDDPDAMTLENGKSIFHQPDAEHPDGYMLPFHLDTRATSAQKIPSTSHAWGVQHEAWNHGKMDKWLEAHRKSGRCQWAVLHGLSHAGGYPVSIRPGGGVHDLRRLSLFAVRPDVAESHVLDDGND